MRRLLRLLPIVLITLVMGLYTHSARAVQLTPGMWDNWNEPLTAVGTTGFSLHSSASWFAGTAMTTTSFSAELYLSVIGPQIVVYRQTTTSRDDIEICIVGVGGSCETIANVTSPTNNHNPYLYDLEAYTDRSVLTNGVTVRLKKATNNSLAIFIPAIYVYPFTPSYYPTPEGIAQLPTPDGVTVYSTVEYDPEETPQVTAFRYEYTAEGTLQSIFLFAIVVLLGLILLLLVLLYARRERG